MQRVLVITTNLQQASFRLRIGALRALLAGRGIELDVQVRPKNWLARRTFLRSAYRYDSVILQRKLLDPSDARLLRRRAKKIFYDVDDAVMHHAHRVGAWSQWRTNRRFAATARMVDHVVCGNEHLADIFRRQHKPVTVLPTCVDPIRYRVKAHASASPVTLVWIGSNSTLPYLQHVLPALQQVQNISLLTIGDKPLDAPGVAIEHVPWSIDTEADALARGDIGIAPTPADQWTIGKSGFKIVQYMAAGLPVVASPVGANAAIVHDGKTGTLATTTQQWIDAIAKLAGDVALRARMGKAGRERVEREFSLAHAANVWTKLLS